MSYTVMCSVILGPSRSGLTLQYRLFNTSGAYIAAAVTAGFERGATGTYLVPVVAPDAHQGGIDFLNASGGAILASGDWNPRELENADILSSTIATGGIDLSTLPADVWAYGSRTLSSSGPITIVSPWAASGTLELGRGAAYTADLGTLIPAITLASTAPDLTDFAAALTLEIGVKGAAPKLIAAVTLSGPTSAQILQIGDITSAQTAVLAEGAGYRFTLWVADDADRWPVIEGPVLVEALA